MVEILKSQKHPRVSLVKNKIVTPRTHCDESRQKESQISFSLEQDCTVSNKVPEKTDSVNR